MPGFIVNAVSGHIWSLRYGLTTVGNTNCDILINDDLADQQHAVVQYNAQSTDFSIRDLNTSHGIFLNNSNFRNATSPLTHGDSIAFSENGPLFIFCNAQSPNDALLYVQRYQSSNPKTEVSLPIIPNLPVSMPQPQMTFTHDMALKDRWAVQTQSGAWTQIAPIPPPKPPMYSMRGRPSSASSVSRLVRQPAIIPQHPPPRTQNTSQGSNIRNQYQFTATSNSSGHGQVSPEVVESIARQLNSRSNSRHDSGSLNETFNVDTSGTNLHTQSAELENENRILAEQLQMLRDDLSQKEGRIASLHAATDSASDMIKERERQMVELKQKLDATQRLYDELRAEKTEEVAGLRDHIMSAERESQDAKEKLSTAETENDLLKEELESLRKEAEKSNEFDAEKERITALHDQVVNDLNAKYNDLKQFVDKLKSHCVLGEEEAEQESFDGILAYVDSLKSSNDEKETALNNEVNKLQILENEVNTVLEKVNSSCTDLNSLNFFLETNDEDSPSAPIASKIKDVLVKVLSAVSDSQVSVDTNASLNDIVACLNDNGLNVEENASSDAIKSCLREFFESHCQLKSDFDSLNEQHEIVCKEKEEMAEKFESEMTIKMETIKTGWIAEKQSEIDDLTNAKTDLEAQVQAQSEALEASREENENLFISWKIEFTESHAKEIEKIIAEKEAEIHDLKQTHLQEVETLNGEKSKAEEDMNAKIDEMNAKISELETAVTEQENSISQLTESHKTVSDEKDSLLLQIEQLQTEKSTLEEALQAKEAELEALNEQQGRESDETFRMVKLECQEHAKTIVKLEEKIIALSQENEENIKMRESAVTEKEETIAKYTRDKPKIPPKPASIAPVRTMEDLHALEQLVLLLRGELSEAKKQLKDNETVIEGLARDLAGANARLNDVAGELSESQKEEVERSQALVRDLEVQLASIKVQVDSALAQKHQMTQDVEQLTVELQNSKQMVEQLKTQLGGKESELVEMRKQLFEQVQINERQMAVQKEQTRIAEELSGMGAQCKGERHLQVMQRQKEALSDLRHRIKLLEQNRPPIPTADQALGQVALLQRELAELKAQQGAGSGQDIPGLDIDDEDFMDADSGEVKKGRGKIEEALLKANRVENAEALDLSEKSYFSLTKSLARRLGLENMNGNRTLAHISRDEREKLFVEREKDIEQINSNVGALQSRVERKDELLNTYEKDLNKLREMEAIAAQKQKEVLKANADLRAKKEEIEFIREALRRTKEDYEREKRLNVAIKSKKGEFLEQFEKQAQQNKSGMQGVNKTGHSCVPEDVMGKDSRRKREENERLKKKSYEVEKLKELLKEKENQISELSVKVVNYESTAEAH
ncbi:forkhead-associated domain-containing protein 1-like [Symsagittifera roscoffensis]|uniref:forkhead-associated domain-containing protein 1-like n=1 Tax=Symsagittifera roscoffensis TaxID=84072 RepID=UPI00307CB2C9